MDILSTGNSQKQEKQLIGNFSAGMGKAQMYRMNYHTMMDDVTNVNKQWSDDLMN